MDYDEIKELLNNEEKISSNLSFKFARFCSNLINIEKNETKARDIVIRILDSIEKFEESDKKYWYEFIESLGVYPYLNLDYTSSIGEKMRYSFHKSSYLNEITFHKDQLKASLLLLNKKNVILSAPTSFGKSLLFEEIIASNLYQNIVIIQPTLALLDETRLKLNKYNDKYKIIVKTSQKPDEKKGNIFLFTSERVLEYKDFPKIDFFVIDEFYKLSMRRIDERSPNLNLAFHKLANKMKANFYLLGPYIKKVPDGFCEHYDATFIKSDFNTVSVDINDYYSSKDKKKRLFELLEKIEGQTIIYCSGPQKTQTLALDFMEYCKEKNINKRNGSLDIQEWINKNIHKNWGLNLTLNYSIAMHNGAMPRHITTSIIDYFNNEEIKFLFCTTTIIEGVNTNAKNMVIFDESRGKGSDRKSIPLDPFDYNNIKGRAGRMKQHFIGKIYNFTKEFPTEEIEVEIPIFTQEPSNKEILIQLEEKEIKNKKEKNYIEISSLDKNLKSVLKKNQGMSIDGQVKVVKEIESNLNKYHKLISWDKFPNFESLTTVLELAFNFLLSSTESKSGVKSPKQLAYYTNHYTRGWSPKRFIEQKMNDEYHISKTPNEQKRLNLVSKEVLSIYRHWFDYKLPKLISTINELQRYVFEKNNLSPGDYSMYLTYLENAALPQNLSTLIDYGIPGTALAKLRKFIHKEASEETVLNTIKTINLKSAGLIDYEINKIKKNLI